MDIVLLNFTGKFSFASKVAILLSLNLFLARDETRLVGSSIGLDFLNPTLKLKRWDVTSFRMQLENIEDR